MHPTADPAAARKPAPQRDTTRLDPSEIPWDKSRKTSSRRPSAYRTVILAVAFSLPIPMFIEAGPSWQTLVALAYYSALLAAIWYFDHQRLVGLLDKLASTLELVHVPSKLPPSLAPPHSTLADAVANLNFHLRNLHQRFRSTAYKAHLEGQKELANAIQADLQPRKIPEIPGLHLAVWQSKAAGIGGDFYDFIVKPEEFTGNSPEEFDFCLADVKGKAIKSALLLALTRSTIRNKAKYFSSPSRIVTRANEDLSRDMSVSDIFVAMFFASYRVADRTLYYASADFPPPIMRRADGNVFQLKTEDFILGTVEGQDYEERAVQLQAGDLIIGYSAGIRDARSPRREKLGFERLVDFVRVNGDLPIDDLMEALKQMLVDWQEGEARHEDQTVLILQAV